MDSFFWRRQTDRFGSGSYPQPAWAPAASSAAFLRLLPPPPPPPPLRSRRSARSPGERRGEIVHEHTHTEARAHMHPGARANRESVSLSSRLFRLLLSRKSNKERLESGGQDVGSFLHLLLFLPPPPPLAAPPAAPGRHSSLLTVCFRPSAPRNV